MMLAASKTHQIHIKLKPKMSELLSSFNLTFVLYILFFFVLNFIKIYYTYGFFFIYYCSMLIFLCFIVLIFFFPFFLCFCSFYFNVIFHIFCLEFFLHIFCTRVTSFGMMVVPECCVLCTVVYLCLSCAINKR